MGYQIETKYKEGDILVPYSRNKYLLVIAVLIGGGVKNNNSYSTEDYLVYRFDFLDDAINFNYLSKSDRGYPEHYVLDEYIENHENVLPLNIHMKRNIYADFKEL